VSFNFGRKEIKVEEYGDIVLKMRKLKAAYGIKLSRPKFGFMFNVEKGLSRLKSRKQKSVKTAYLLAIFLGPFGAHHFYLNRWFLGVVYLCTFGILGFGWIVDLFRIPSLVEDENDNDESHRNEKNLIDAYLVWFPFGLIGESSILGRGLSLLRSYGILDFTYTNAINIYHYTSPGQVKPKTTKLVFADFPLSTQY
jgi:TM2 domain-containing membrane protein YozV